VGPPDSIFGNHVIEIQELYKYYGDRRAIGPLSTRIAQGEVVGLLVSTGIAAGPAAVLQREPDTAIVDRLGHAQALTLLDQFFSRSRSHPFRCHEACRSARADTSQRENRRNRAPAASTTGRDAGRLGSLTAKTQQLPAPLELGKKVTK